MKTSSAELKRTARENLSGKYGVAMLAMITVSLIPSALLYPFLQITPVTAVHHKKDNLLSGFYYYYCASVDFNLWSVTTSFKYRNQTTLSVF